MKSLNIKNLEEVKLDQDKKLSEIKRDYKIQTVLIVCFKSMSLAIDYEALKKEKQALEDLTGTQNSMISDLEEKCKYLYIEIENLKFGGNE